MAVESQRFDLVRSTLDHEAQNHRLLPSAWPNPLPLPEGLPPVEPFDHDLLPPVLRRRVEDIADRMQCPPDFPAVAMLVVLASIIGRRLRIAPKRADDWIVVPNLWGVVIGRPGSMKSPALAEVMRPLQVLETRAVEAFKQQCIEHQADLLVAAESERVTRETVRKMLKAGNRTAAEECAEEALSRESPEPVCRRYLVNDTTVEKLGEILSENPSGVLLYRDELSGFLRSLERQGHEADRAFYLECWNGDGAFTYDRIGRGTVHIAGVCLSILGSIQPGPLSDSVRDLRGSGDDGLLQRFQLAVWPDQSSEWRNVDRLPDRAAQEAVQAIVEQLDRVAQEMTSAHVDCIPTLRFSDEAQALFDQWREDLERRLRGGEEHPALEAHLAKYRSLVPSLALVLHLTERTEGPVDTLPLVRAIAWAEYLETHARRIYAPAISPDMDAARALAKRIKGGDVAVRFGLREVYNRGWSGLSTRDATSAAVQVLIDHHWLQATEEPTAGRSRTVYWVNPAVLHGECQS